MRSYQEILGKLSDGYAEANKSSKPSFDAVHDLRGNLILEVLLDVRELLQERSKRKEKITVGAPVVLTEKEVALLEAHRQDNE